MVLYAIICDYNLISIKTAFGELFFTRTSTGVPSFEPRCVHPRAAVPHRHDEEHAEDHLGHEARGGGQGAPGAGGGASVRWARKTEYK